jgi:hypothetical protein
MSAGALPAAGTEEAVADRMVDAIKEALAGDPQHFDEMAQAYAEMPGLLAVVAMTAASALFEVVAKSRARIAAIEQRPKGLQYLGVWTRGTDYSPGDVTTDRGAMWVCKTATTDRPGDLRLGGETHWQLAVKAGRDGRDRKDDLR